jgi:di/tricarboxylate transporter
MFPNGTPEIAMRWAAQLGDFAALAFVSFAVAALTLPSALANVPARAHAVSLPRILGWLSTELVVPATGLIALTLVLLFVRDFAARRRRALEAATPPVRYAPYALPARVSVALAAAARARN